MKLDNNALILYAITDRRWLKENTLSDKVKEALEGGVTFLQLREKELNQDDFKREALEIQEICNEYNVPLIINDNVNLAKEINADGVHVGQSDMEALDVRAILGDDKILGVSASTVSEALTAEEHGADYLGVGAVFPTGSKDDASTLSPKRLKEICDAVSIPVVAIGGITKDNLVQLSGTGIDGISVISAIFAQKNIREAAEDLKKRTIKMLNND